MGKLVNCSTLATLYAPMSICCFHPCSLTTVALGPKVRFFGRVEQMLVLQFLISLLQDDRCDSRDVHYLLARTYEQHPHLRPRLDRRRDSPNSTTTKIVQTLSDFPGMCGNDLIKHLRGPRATPTSIRQMISRLIRQEALYREGRCLYINYTKRS